MGSFNTSCFVTKQTISPRDKAVIFPIKQLCDSARSFNLIEGSIATRTNVINKTLVKSYKSICHIDSNWEFAGPMLYATYDDYGRFTIDNTEYNIKTMQSLFVGLAGTLYNVELGRNEYHDIAINMREWIKKHGVSTYDGLCEIWKHLTEGFNEGRCFIYDNAASYALKLAVMSYHTFDYILHKSDKHFENIYKYTLIKYFDRVSKYNDEKMNEMAIYTMNISIPLQFADFIMSLYMDVNYIEAINKSYEKHKSFNEAFINDVYDIMLPIYSFIYVMSDIDANYPCKLEPQTYTGQDYSNEIGKDYINLLKQVNKLIKSNRS